MSEAAREHGDRDRFLGRITARQGPAPAAGPHQPPRVPASVPEVEVRALDGVHPHDPEALLAVFQAAAEAVDAVVHDDGAEVTVAAVVATHELTRAVVSPEPAAQMLVPHLRAAGVDVHPPGLEAVTADLGVTGAVAGIAATGSVVVDADLAGGRATSLLPRVHLCVLDRADLVPGTADVLRRPPRPLPAHRVLVTGPSRTGDIEQIITLGAHGPVALHVLVV